MTTEPWMVAADTWRPMMVKDTAGATPLFLAGFLLIDLVA